MKTCEPLLNVTVRRKPVITASSPSASLEVVAINSHYIKIMHSSSFAPRVNQMKWHLSWKTSLKQHARLVFQHDLCLISLKRPPHHTAWRAAALLPSERCERSWEAGVEARVWVFLINGWQVLASRCKSCAQSDPGSAEISPPDEKTLKSSQSCSRLCSVKCSQSLTH